MARLGHLVLLAAIAPLFAACTQSHAIGLEIVGAPADGSARRFTIRVYRGATCPTMEAFARGTDSALERVYAQTVAPGDALPPVGRLDATAYAFAALARNAACQVIAYGCVVADPSATESVRVELTSVATDPGAPGCEAGVACSDRVCEGMTTCDPTSCTSAGGSMGTCCGATCTDLSSDSTHCGRCDLACAPGVACSRGTCAGVTTGCGADGTACGGATTCCTDRCVDLQTDATACGACDRPCSPDLTCRAGSCRPPETASAVRVRLAGTAIPDCGPLMLVLVWVPPDASAGRVALLGPAIVVDAATMGGDVSFPVWDLGPPGDVLWCGITTDCSGVSIALAQLWLVTDADRNGAVSLAELRGISLLGAADVGIVWSSADVGRDDPRLASLRERTRIGFPEGLVAGAAAYRRISAVGESWSPAGAADVFEVRTCTSGSCMSPIEEACRSALPHPFGFLP